MLFSAVVIIPNRKLNLLRIQGLVILVAMMPMFGSVVWAADPEITQVTMAQRTDGSGMAKSDGGAPYLLCSAS